MESNVRTFPAERSAIITGAALLTGTPARGALRTAGPVTADDPQEYLRPGAPRLQGRRSTRSTAP